MADLPPNTVHKDAGKEAMQLLLQSGSLNEAKLLDLELVLGCWDEFAASGSNHHADLTLMEGYMDADGFLTHCLARTTGMEENRFMAVIGALEDAVHALKKQPVMSRLTARPSGVARSTGTSRAISTSPGEEPQLSSASLYSSGSERRTDSISGSDPQSLFPSQQQLPPSTDAVGSLQNHSNTLSRAQNSTNNDSMTALADRELGTSLALP